MNNLKKARREANLTQAEVGEMVGVSQNTYSYWENGKVRIDQASLLKLAKIFNVTTDYLLGRDSQPYYADKETDEYAERIHKNPQLRILFDATQDLNTNDIDTLLRIVEGLKATKGG